MLAARLAALWLLVVVAAPAAVNMAVGLIAPPPSQQALQEAIRDIANRAERNDAQIYRQYMGVHPELAVVGTVPYQAWKPKYTTMQFAIGEGVLPVLSQYERQLASTHHAGAWLQFLSPAAVAQVALSDAAGTGPEQQAAYVAAVRAYNRDLRTRLAPSIFRAVKLSPDELEALPEFNPPRWAPAAGGKSLAMSFAYLAALCGVLFWMLRRAIAALSPTQEAI
jgi:ABC-2 type transport system permease protein